MVLDSVYGGTPTSKAMYVQKMGLVTAISQQMIRKFSKEIKEASKNMIGQSSFKVKILDCVSKYSSVQLMEKFPTCNYDICNSSFDVIDAVYVDGSDVSCHYVTVKSEVVVKERWRTMREGMNLEMVASMFDYVNENVDKMELVIE